MNWLFNRYMNFFSFIHANLKIHSKGMHESWPINNSIVGCIIYLFGSLSLALLVGLNVLSLVITTASVNFLLILILGLVVLFNIYFKNKFRDEIDILNEQPRVVNISILTFDILSILTLFGLYFFTPWSVTHRP